MSRSIVSRVVVVTVLLAAAQLAGGQLAGAQEYTVPPVAGGVAEGPAFSDWFRFRPFGWSADGKFAWLMSHDIDGRGGTVYTYVIYDAVEDSTVFSKADDSYDWGTDAEATEEESWKRSGEEVSAALAKYGIVQSPGIEVSAFPLQRGGDRYTAALKTRDDPAKGEDDEDRIASYTLTLSSRSRGSKIVTQKDKAGASQVTVNGYILSPKEPRILVVVGERRRAFEGEEETLVFSGAHLLVGFRK